MCRHARFGRSFALGRAVVSHGRAPRRVSTLVIAPPTLFVPFLYYLISLITIRSPLGIATTRTMTGLCPLMSLLQTLLDFIISTTLVLLASSKRTILPSGVSRPKEVVVVVAGQSVTTFVVTVV